MAKRPTKGDWRLYVSVPSRKQAQVDAKRANRYGDGTKIVENRGWFEVWILNPSEGARIILGL